MQKPIYSSEKHKAIIETYILMCTEFVKDSSSKKRYENYLEVLDIIIEYHNNYGAGVKENNWFDWLMIIPVSYTHLTLPTNREV